MGDFLKKPTNDPQKDLNKKDVDNLFNEKTNTGEKFKKENDEMNLILQNKIENQGPQNYSYDKKQSELVLDMDKHKGKFTSAAKYGYGQLNFPYNTEYINKIDVGKIKTLPTGGTIINGKHTNASCAMNAVQVYNTKNSPVLNSNYEIGVNYKYTFVPAVAPTSSPTGAPTGAPIDGSTVAPTIAPTSGPITKSGLYSKILPFSAEDAPVVYPITIELTGFMLPEGGGKGKIKLDPKYQIGTKTMRVWLGMNPGMCTKHNAFIRYDNGVLKETKNSKSSVLFLKNTYIPIIVRYVANSESDIRFYSDNDTLPFVLMTNSNNNIVNFSIYVQPESEIFGSPVYYNFQKETGKCTVYDTRNKDLDTNFLEKSKNYGEYIVEKIMAIQLNSAVEFVGLNELGVFTQYYLDPALALKSEPVKDMNGGQIEASNRGKGGMNKKQKYMMVLHDGVAKFKTKNNKFAFPIEDEKRLGLVENQNWKRRMKTEKSNLEYIDNSRQTSDRGLLTPSMKITKTMPLFSKDYKFKMSIETVGGETHLIIKRTMRNPNLLVSVIPDFKMGRMFVADENSGVNKMYLADNDQTKKNGWYGYKGYGPNNTSSYKISKRSGKGDCARKSSSKSHYFVEKGNCYIPTTEQSMKGYDFVPKLGASLYVPTKSLLENPQKYKYAKNAYSKKGYTNFDLAKDKWNPKINLSKQNDTYNDVNNYSRTAIILNSQPNVKGTALVMPGLEGFADEVGLQNRTRDQIVNNVEPRFNLYLNNQTQVNSNAQDIKRIKTRIDAKYNVLSNKQQFTNGVANNVFYDFTDKEIYSLKEDRSLVPAILKDQQTMIVEHNKLFVISTITVATLLISAIFVSSN